MALLTKADKVTWSDIYYSYRIRIRILPETFKILDTLIMWGTQGSEMVIF